jgi:predicted nucleic acid-binding protein
MSLKYLLDTNIFSELMRPVPNPKIVKIVDRYKEETATASIASSNDLILVTNNVGDFQYFENLKIENWFESGDNP